MFLKLVGSISVVLASSFIGYVLSRDFSRRPVELRDLQTMLHMFENEISYLSNLLTDAFERINKANNSVVTVFFEDTVKCLRKNENLTASEAWEYAVRKNIKRTALNKEDEEILVSFGRMLGSSDLEGQIRNIKLALKRLENQEKKAEELRVKNESMYKRLGLLGGLAIVIIFI